jgi:toxin ParE1/3/4
VIVRLSAPSRQDIVRILDHSEREFGTEARFRYSRLITAALRDLQKSDHPFGSKLADTDPGDIHLYHLRNARQRSGAVTVLSPRHFIVYRHVDERLTQILRILHDSMDIAAHL